jgi:hypothetical protein
MRRQELIGALLTIAQAGVFIARRVGHPNRVLDGAKLAGDVGGVDHDMG